MQYKGVYISGYITSDFPVQDIDNVVFLNEFIKWIEEKNMQFCGSCVEYKYDSWEYNTNE